MRYSLLTAALAAAVYASPLIVRDQIVDYAYVTQVVTVTAGQPAPTSEVSVAAVPSSTKKHWNWHWSHSSSAEASAEASASAGASAPKGYTTQAAPKPKTTQKATPTATEQPAATTDASASSYSDIVVLHHNIHRANHSAGEMTWDQGLADTAMKIAQSCNYAHNVNEDGGNYGQNIAAGAPQDNVSSIITDHFYNDEAPYFDPFYNEATPSDMSDEIFDHYGHFTQIIWKGTHKVGCATYDCKDHGNGPNGLGNVASNVPPYFTVCNYSPPGNYLGEFNNNVVKGQGKPTVNWSYGIKS